MTQIEGNPLGEGQGENPGYIKKIKGFFPPQNQKNKRVLLSVESASF